MVETVLEGHRCPSCGKELDRATSPFDEALVPRAGDFSLCIGCGGFMVFDRGLIVRKPTPEEAVELEISSEARRIIAAWLKVKR